MAIVAWNDLQKSWDCPLHGSRFTPTGAVMNGPTNKVFKRIDVDVDDSAAAAIDDDTTRKVPMYPHRK